MCVQTPNTTIQTYLYHRQYLTIPAFFIGKHSFFKGNIELMLVSVNTLATNKIVIMNYIDEVHWQQLFIVIYIARLFQ